MHKIGSPDPGSQQRLLQQCSPLHWLETQGRRRLEPWSFNSSYFHGHLPNTQLNCPRSLTLQPLKKEDNGHGSWVEYLSQATTMKGGQICNLFEVSRELHKDTYEITREVDVWIQMGVMAWIDDQVTYKLAPPLRN